MNLSRKKVRVRGKLVILFWDFFLARIDFHMFASLRIFVKARIKFHNFSEAKTRNIFNIYIYNNICLNKIFRLLFKSIIFVYKNVVVYISHVHVLENPGRYLHHEIWRPFIKNVYCIIFSLAVFIIFISLRYTITPNAHVQQAVAAPVHPVTKDHSKL